MRKLLIALAFIGALGILTPPIAFAQECTPAAVVLYQVMMDPAVAEHETLQDGNAKALNLTINKSLGLPLEADSTVAFVVVLKHPDYEFYKLLAVDANGCLLYSTNVSHSNYDKLKRGEIVGGNEV